MKHIRVKVSGSENDPVEIELNHKTTAGEILSALNLEGFILTSPRISTRKSFREGKSFSQNETLYPQLHDGAILVAKTYAEYWERIFQGLTPNLGEGQ